MELGNKFDYDMFLLRFLACEIDPLLYDMVNVKRIPLSLQKDIYIMMEQMIQKFGSCSSSTKANLIVINAL